VIVVAAIIVRDGNILACQRSAAGKFPLKWEFPGGKVQPNETPEVALARELTEELNIAATIGPQIFRTHHKYAEMDEAVELLFFKAEIDSDEIENRVFNDMRWLSPEGLPKLDFLTADFELVQKLARGEISL
jgi:8-oxo-dGTP diphosphatase